MNDFLNKIKESLNNILKSGEEKKVNKKVDVANLLILVLLGAILLIGANIFSNKDKMVNAKENIKGNVSQNDKDRGENNKETINNIENINNYSDELNKKLRNILSLIDGVGKVETMIYFEKGEEYVPAINQNNSISKTEETDTKGGKRTINQNNDGKTIVTFNDNNNTKPLITQTKAPKITGLCVVAEGADDKVTELRIIEAVVNLFNLPENKVQVYPMKK